MHELPPQLSNNDVNKHNEMCLVLQLVQNNVEYGMLHIFII